MRETFANRLREDRDVPAPTAVPAPQDVQSNGAGGHFRAHLRPRVRGKFIYVGDEKLHLKGVTYGTFSPVPGDGEYGARATVERDFDQMAAAGLNAVRTYTVPPRWLLDAAQRHRLLVMVGLPWEQHVTFLDDRRRVRSIEKRVREGVQACAGHPAVLCYVIGNEIPAPIVRWHGRRRIERFLRRLYEAAKSVDPDALVTYVNYPSTEYLQLPFLDFVAFNVFLERREQLESYLARLQSVAEGRPLVMTEIGLDSRRNGAEQQARVLSWQVSTAFAGGCAGAFVFSWTDEWHRGGFDIEDWDFGLTDRQRRPKPALAAVRGAFGRVPFPPDLEWPSASVVVCSHNGAKTIRECLEGIGRLRYPAYEVIVVDDGSTDATASIAAEHDCKLIRTANRGLSAARNTGIEAASGEIVAFTDDDATPDPDWLTFLVHGFEGGVNAGVGGPNLGCPDDGPIARCVSHAPGGPTHVLVSDTEAEHIPGCNMAFRREALLEAGGFDEQFAAAGDDVDICWRLRSLGRRIGFSPAAVVWHHRRPSVRGYWRQQRSYGKAEAALERKWPEKYSTGGHVTWGGRLYGDGFARNSAPGRWRVYYGSWGSGLFQSIYRPTGRISELMPLLPESYLVIGALALLSALGLAWDPLLIALPLLALALGSALFQALLSALKPTAISARGTRVSEGVLRALTACLYLLQPAARLSGRVAGGLTPWRRRGAQGFRIPLPRSVAVWSEHWAPVSERLESIEAAVQATATAVIRGGDYDRWDLEVRAGPLGAARIRAAVEEHGGGRQLTRFQLWPKLSRSTVLATLFVVGLVAAAVVDGAWAPAAMLGLIASVLIAREFQECAAGMASAAAAITERRSAPAPVALGAVVVEDRV